MLDPCSPWGYERKHAALHGAGRYEDAIRTFEKMLLRISQSTDPEIRGECIDMAMRSPTDIVSQSFVIDA